MTVVYRIAKWDEVFENAESRKLKKLGWVAFPVDMNSKGYMSLLQTFGDDSPAIYGAWSALVCVAARRPRRGTLAHSNGEPMTLANVAFEARFPVAVMQRMFDWAISKPVAWIELAETPEETPDTPGESPGNQQSDPVANRTTLNDTTLNGKTLPIDRSGERTEGDALDAPIDWGSDLWRDGTPWLSQIAKTVTKNEATRFDQLRDCDADLCFVAVALELRHPATDEWLDPILRGLAARKKPPDNPWGFFRSCLTKAAEDRGLKFHELEKLVVVPKKAQPLPTPA